MTEPRPLTDDDFDVELQPSDEADPQGPAPRGYDLSVLAQIVALAGAVLIVIAYFQPWYRLGDGVQQTIQRFWIVNMGTWGDAFVLGSLGLACVVAIVVFADPGRPTQILGLGLAGGTLVAVVAGFSNLVSETRDQSGGGADVHLLAGFGTGLVGAILLALAVIIQAFIAPVLAPAAPEEPPFVELTVDEG